MLVLVLEAAEHTIDVERANYNIKWCNRQTKAGETYWATDSGKIKNAQ